MSVFGRLLLFAALLVTAPNVSFQIALTSERLVTEASPERLQAFVNFSDMIIEVSFS